MTVVPANLSVPHRLDCKTKSGDIRGVIDQGTRNAALQQLAAPGSE